MSGTADPNEHAWVLALRIDRYAALPYVVVVHTVVETAAYMRAAKASGMTNSEMEAAVDLVAGNPEVGELIQGTGGCRKVRLAGKGRGKSGGYRLITFFWTVGQPVYLLTMFGKGERANITDKEKAALQTLVKSIARG